MRVEYNSRNTYFKNPFGAVKVNEEVTFRIKVFEPIKSLKCFLVMWQDDEKLKNIEMERESQNEDGSFTYKTTFIAPNNGIVIWYHFILQNIDEKYFYSNNENQYGGEGILVENCPKSYQLTVYEESEIPSWYSEGIVYQIFPDRFNKGEDFNERWNKFTEKNKGKNYGKYVIENWNENPKYVKDENGNVNSFGFYGGTLKGIIKKLPYIKELGVSCIYLNPIFEARSNHRYDTANYKQIDYLLGDEETFTELINEAKKLNMKIVLDGVFSHQGADSVYFNKYNNYDSIGAYNNKDSQYFHWYNFKNYPDEYECWWGVKDLPNVNEMNESYLNYICKDDDSVIKHWMKKGIGGFRLDVADELPDEFITEIKKAMDSVNKDNILLGEVWEDATNKISYDVHRKYFLNNSLKSVTNYPFMKNAVMFFKGEISGYELCEFFFNQMENYPNNKFYANLNLLDTHDTVRIINILSDSNDESSMTEEEKINYVISEDKYSLAISRLKCLTVLQFMIPGVPLIYYGTEAGIYGYADPYNRKTYPWGSENTELLEHYKKISNIRNNSEVIKKGSFEPFYFGLHGFGIRRKYNNEEIVVLLNRGIFYNEEENADIYIDEHYSKAIDLVNNETFNVKDNKINVHILPLGYKVLKLC